MSIGTGGTTSNTPKPTGVDGGDLNKNRISQPSETEVQFHDEAIVHMSTDPDALSNANLVNAFDNKKNSAFEDNKPASTESNEHQSTPFYKVSLQDIAKALIRHSSEKQESNNASKNQTFADTGARRSNGFLDVTAKENQSGKDTDASIAMNTGGSSYADTGRLTDTAVNHGNINDLMYYGNRNANNPGDTARLIVNSQTGPIGVQLNPLQAANGEIVRTQNGQPLVQSMAMINQSGQMGMVDFRDISMANQSHIPQQGLILDSMQPNPNAVVFMRQDGARIGYQPYLAPDNSMQSRIVGVFSQEGTREYSYNNMYNPGLATTIVDNLRSSDGTQLQQVRERVGASDTFQMTEWNLQTGQIVRHETERYVQTRIDGQIVYQRYTSPEELQARVRSGEFDNRKDLNGRSVSKEDIVNAIKNDKTWLVANDLSSAKRQFLAITKGKLFGGDDTKTAHYIDMYVTRIRDHRKMGYYTDSEDQLAASLRRAASVFTTQRSGEAAKMTNKSLVDHTEDMLRTMGDPLKFVNQGQVGSCFVVSTIIAAMYIAPNKVMDKWASVLTTGKTDDGRAKFTAAELNKPNHMGETRFDFLTVSMCNDNMSGRPGAKLGGMGSGSSDWDAQKNHKWLTGIKAPFGSSAWKKYGVRYGFTPGHARTHVAIAKKNSNGTLDYTKIEDYFNNTWDGAGEKRSPLPHVEIVA